MMTNEKQYGDVNVTQDGHVAIVEIRRAPHNFFDAPLIESLLSAFNEIDEDKNCRAIVLCSEGKSFCAGANFSTDDNDEKREGGNKQIFGEDDSSNPLYDAAIGLFSNKKPVVAAIQGAAIGGGLGLALVADFRVACPEARFCANFSKLGIHPGFGLTHTLPSLVGQQKSALMFYTGRRIGGDQAHEWGLADVLCEQSTVRAEALKLAAEIAESAPLALISVRETLREGLSEKLKQQTDRENSEQSWQQRTVDFREGVKAVSERRVGNFIAE